MIAAVAALEGLVLIGATVAILLFGGNASVWLSAGVGTIAVLIAVQLRWISVDLAVARSQQIFARTLFGEKVDPELLRLAAPAVCSAQGEDGWTSDAYGRPASVVDPSTGEVLVVGTISSELSDSYVRLRTATGSLYAVPKADVHFLDGAS